MELHRHGMELHPHIIKYLKFKNLDLIVFPFVHIKTNYCGVTIMSLLKMQYRGVSIFLLLRAISSTRNVTQQNITSAFQETLVHHVVNYLEYKVR
jgi:hypothetical protein